MCFQELAAELFTVVASWPNLAKTIRSAILAPVREDNNEQEIKDATLAALPNGLTLRYVPSQIRLCQ